MAGASCAPLARSAARTRGRPRRALRLDFAAKPRTGFFVAEQLDHSAVAELADVILVALGLRVVALVLYPPQPDGHPKMLVLADDLPPGPERGAFLASLTSRESLGNADIVLRTPAEFSSDAWETYAELAAGGRILTDRRGIVAPRLRDLSSSQPGVS